MNHYKRAIEFIIKNPWLPLSLLFASTLPVFLSVLSATADSAFLTFSQRLTLIGPSRPSLDNHAELVPLFVNLFLSSFPAEQNILILPFSILLFVPAYTITCILLDRLSGSQPSESQTFLRGFPKNLLTFLIFGISYLVFWLSYYVATGIVALPLVALFYLLPRAIAAFPGYLLYLAFFVFGMILWARFSLWLPLMICEKRSVTDALKTSFHLTRRSWRTILLVGVLNLICFTGFSVVFGMIPKMGPVFSVAFSSLGLTILTAYLFLLSKHNIKTNTLNTPSSAS